MRDAGSLVANGVVDVAAYRTEWRNDGLVVKGLVVHALLADAVVVDAQIEALVLIGKAFHLGVGRRL